MTRSRQRWFQNIFDIYERMRRKAQDGVYETNVPFSLCVYPNVYAPDFFTDSAWFSERLPQLVGSGRLLEIGTGTGVIAISCARNQAQVVATDINPEAVSNALENVKRHGLDERIVVRHGDVFSCLRPSELFDVIFWAHPFNNWESVVDDVLLLSGMDHHYNSLHSYISNGHKHLESRGRLLLGTGDSADLDSIREICASSACEMVELDCVTMPLEEGKPTTITYMICEVVKV